MNETSVDTTTVQLYIFLNRFGGMSRAEILSSLYSMRAYLEKIAKGEEIPHIVDKSYARGRQSLAKTLLGERGGR